MKSTRGASCVGMPGLWALAGLILGGLPLAGLQPAAGQAVVEDFESYQSDSWPTEWKYVSRDKDILPARRVMSKQKKFYVVEEGGNKFLRGYTKGEALRISLRNGKEFSWKLPERPYLQWRWRAHKLPTGASEKDKNDTGGALYVTFGADWLGRPKSIKYTYSSTLPVGTIVSFGPLKVIVVASGAEPGKGRWKTETRDVASDYRNVFGDAPPDRPLSITLWSDSNTTGDEAEVDFDDITLQKSL